MSDKYGYLIYNDYVEGTTDFTVEMATSDVTLQDESKLPYDIFKSSDRPYISKIKNYATFEPNGFDFGQPIYVPDTAGVGCAIKEFGNSLSLTITSELKPSSSGISLKTYMDDYSLSITVNDVDGQRTKSFIKNYDEFYVIPYTELTKAIITITPPDNCFVKLVAIGLGRVLKFGGKNLVNTPRINTHFSLTNDELEYDTLDFEILGRKSEYNIVVGEKVTVSKDNRIFYIDNFNYNENGTISITAYDSVSQMETIYMGSMRVNRDSLASIKVLAGAGINLNKVDGEFLYDNQLWSGVTEPQVSYREALRLFMRGNAVSLVRNGNNSWRVFCPYRRHNVDNEFNEKNIVNELPTVDFVQKPAKIKFAKHSFTVDRRNVNIKKLKTNTTSTTKNLYTTLVGYGVAYDGEIDNESKKDAFRIWFDTPVANKSFYYYDDSVSEPQRVYYGIGGTQALTHPPDSDGDIQTDIFEMQSLILPTGEVGVINQSGYFCVDIVVPKKELTDIKTLSLMCVGKIYQDKVYMLSTSYRDEPSFNNKEVEITDTRLILSLEGTGKTNYNDFNAYLRYIYQFKDKVTLQSILDISPGSYVHIVFNNYNSYGWITQKTDNLNGLYEYEVMCK